MKPSLSAYLILKYNLFDLPFKSLWAIRRALAEAYREGQNSRPTKRRVDKCLFDGKPAKFNICKECADELC